MYFGQSKKKTLNDRARGGGYKNMSNVLRDMPPNQDIPLDVVQEYSNKVGGMYYDTYSQKIPMKDRYTSMSVKETRKMQKEIEANIEIGRSRGTLSTIEHLSEQEKEEMKEKKLWTQFHVRQNPSPAIHAPIPHNFGEGNREDRIGITTLDRRIISEKSINFLGSKSEYHALEKFTRELNASADAGSSNEMSLKEFESLLGNYLRLPRHLATFKKIDNMMLAILSYSLTEFGRCYVGFVFKVVRLNPELAEQSPFNFSEEAPWRLVLKTHNFYFPCKCN